MAAARGNGMGHGGNIGSGTLADERIAVAAAIARQVREQDPAAAVYRCFGGDGLDVCVFSEQYDDDQALGPLINAIWGPALERPEVDFDYLVRPRDDLGRLSTEGYLQL